MVCCYFFLINDVGNGDSNNNTDDDTNNANRIITIKVDSSIIYYTPSNYLMRMKVAITFPIMLAPLSVLVDYEELVLIILAITTHLFHICNLPSSMKCSSSSCFV